MSKKNRRPTALGAMLAFVVAVKLLVEAIVHVIALPVEALLAWLPAMDAPGTPRLSRFKEWFMSHAHTHSPSWAVHNGNFTVLMKTQAGSHLLDGLVDRAPTSVIDCWLRFSVGVMALWLLGWALLLIRGLVATARVLSEALGNVLIWIVNYDWSLLFQPRQSSGISPKQLFFEIVSSIPEIVQSAVAFTVSLVLFMAVYWLIMAFLLPGLAFHEFGHYAAIRKSVSSVDSYGLLFFGPMPVGAFVEPADDLDDLALGSRLKIYSAGVANSLIFGSALLSCGLLLNSGPFPIADMMLMRETWIGSANNFGVIMLLLGLVEVASSFLNAMPFGMVDGGRFVQSAEREFWGMEKSMSIKQKIRQFTGRSTQ